MKKHLYWFIIIGIIVLGGALFIYKTRPPVLSPQASSVNTDTNFGIKKENAVSLTIFFEPKDSKTYTINYAEGMSAYDALDTVSKKENIPVKTKKYDIGTFIDAIGGKNGGDEGKYWLYYVNGKPPSIAADKQILQPEDRVEFRFEKSPY